MHQRTVKNQNKPVKKPLKSTIDIKNIQLSPSIKALDISHSYGFLLVKSHYIRILAGILLVSEKHSKKLKQVSSPFRNPEKD